MYVQQAPTAAVYSAPAPVTYSAPAVYSAPAPITYSAPAPATYSAPAVYSAPAPVTYSAPAVYSVAAASTYSAPAASVGNAPTAGIRIKLVDRNDIIAELRKEAKDQDKETSARERRKALRDLARTKYAEAIEVGDSELNDAENQDIDAVVNSIVDTNSVGQAPGAQAPGVFTGYAPAAGYTYAPTGYTYAPVYSAPYPAAVQPAFIVQPVAPVQLYLPIQPKHHLFHK